MASPIDFVSGCFGGAAGVIIGHPFDTVKVKMQTSQQQISALSIIRNCSIASLYQGIRAPLTGLAAINAVVFGVYGSVMRFCPTTITTTTTTSNEQHKQQQQNLLWSGVAGFFAGLSQSFISAPTELVKTRAQINAISEWNCMKQIIKNEKGLRGLYRGFGITMARDCPAFATYFFTYEWLINHFQQQRLQQQQYVQEQQNNESKNQQQQQQQQPSTFDILFAGGTAGAISWFVIYPLDVLKSRLQANDRYSSASHCLRDTINNEGFNVLMRGCGPTLIRAFPSNGATFVVVTWTLLAYEKYFNQCNNNQIYQSQDIRIVTSTTSSSSAAKKTTTTKTTQSDNKFIQE